MIIGSRPTAASPPTHTPNLAHSGALSVQAASAATTMPHPGLLGQPAVSTGILCGSCAGGHNPDTRQTPLVADRACRKCILPICSECERSPNQCRACRNDPTLPRIMVSSRSPRATAEPEQHTNHRHAAETAAPDQSANHTSIPASGPPNKLPLRASVECLLAARMVVREAVSRTIIKHMASKDSRLQHGLKRNGAPRATAGAQAQLHP